MNAWETRELRKTLGSFTLGPITLALPEGCIMGLVGENGAGKTTLIRLLLGALRPDGGEAELLGRAPDLGVPEDVGVAPDEISLPSGLTARQIGRVMRGIYPRWDEGVFEGYLRTLGVPDSKRFSELSQGMRKKLGVAVALSHGARLLILDEPANGLDPVVRDELVTLLGEFTRDARNAVLLSSHIVGDLERIADYIAFLHRGQLLLCEEKDALLDQYGLMRCANDTLAKLPPEAILSARTSAYGAEAVVRRALLPDGAAVTPVTLEELFVAMVKGGKS